MSAVQNLKPSATVAEEPREKNRVVRRFLRHRLAVIGLVVLIALILVAVFAPQIAPHDPNKIDATSLTDSPTHDHLLGLDQVGTGAGFNYGKYSSKQMDDLLTQGKNLVKFEDRKKIYDQAHELFVKDVPLLPLYAVKALCVVNKRVIGAKPGPNGLTWNAHLWDVK